MRFMMLVKSSDEAEAGVLPREKVLSDRERYDQEIQKAGVLLAGEGLQPSSKGARVRYSAGKLKVIDGPFAEARELVAGFWLVQVKSRAEAIEWAKRAPFQEGEIEVRQLFELEDFPVDPSEKPDGWREKEQRFREQGPPPLAAEHSREKKLRFMGLLKADRSTEAGVLPDEKLLASMGQFMEEVIKAGVLLSGEGLQPSSKGARVRFSGDKRTVIDGPFTESKELVAGYSILEVRSREEAIEWTKRFLRVDVDMRHATEGECEIRQLF